VARTPNARGQECSVFSRFGLTSTRPQANLGRVGMSSICCIIDFWKQSIVSQSQSGGHLLHSLVIVSLAVKPSSPSSRWWGPLDGYTTLVTLTRLGRLGLSHGESFLVLGFRCSDPFFPAPLETMRAGQFRFLLRW
jgi:hypothetical protein